MTGGRLVQLSPDHLRARHLGMDPQAFIERRDLLRRQAQALLWQERRARIRRRLALFLLPWAGLLTLLPYSNRLSRFLDRLTAEAEKE